MKSLVLNLFPSCEYNPRTWWGYFPDLLVENCRAQGWDAQNWYWRYVGVADTSILPTVSVEDLCSPAWVRAQLLPLLQRYDRSIVHTHGFPIRTALWTAKKELGDRLRWVVTDHFALARTAMRWTFLKRLRNWAAVRQGKIPDLLIGISLFNVGRLRRLFGARRVALIYNGIRLPVAVVSRSTKKPWRGLFVGRLCREKGVYTILDALRIAKEKKVSIKVTFVGPNLEETGMARVVHEYGIGEMLYFAGSQTDMEAIYCDHDFVLIPSIWNEPFSLVSVEAQAHGLPCLYSARGGLPETQRADCTGIVIDPEDPVSLVSAIEQLQQEPARYAQLEDHARHHARAFSVERMVQQYVARYETLFCAE